MWGDCIGVFNIWTLDYSRLPRLDCGLAKTEKIAEYPIENGCLFLSRTRLYLGAVHSFFTCLHCLGDSLLMHRYDSFVRGSLEASKLVILGCMFSY